VEKVGDTRVSGRYETLIVEFATSFPFEFGVLNFDIAERVGPERVFR
jgi:hypothetical protein